MIGFGADAFGDGGAGAGRRGREWEQDAGRGYAARARPPVSLFFSPPPPSPILLPVNCSPLAVLVQPGDAYALDAHPAVVPTLTPGGALHLGVRAFNASGPVVVRVTLPASALTRVATSAGPVTVAPGFDGPALTLVNTGGATLYVSGLASNGTHVAVSNSGAGAVVVDALFRSASVEGAGTGATFIRGVLRGVEVALGGLARVAIEPATPDALVRGNTAGMAGVQLTRGRCAVQSDNGGFFGPPCAPVVGVVLPTPVTTWSCGLAVAVDGVVGCDPAAGRNAVVLKGGGGGGGGGNFISTSTGGRGSTFMTSSTNGGAGGASFVSSGGTGGIGGGGGVFMTSTGGGNTVLTGGGNGGGASNFYTIGEDGSIHQAPVVRAPACTATAEEVKMTLA